MAFESFKVDVDVQITILEFREIIDNICTYLWDLNDRLLVNLDAIISLALITHVAWSIIMSYIIWIYNLLFIIKKL